MKDDWIEWNGGECPVDGDVVVAMRDGFVGSSPAPGLRWSHLGNDGDIVAYRLHTANDNHPQEDAFMAPLATPPGPPADVKAAIADEAKRIVTGARRAAYGTPEDNFARIARFWRAYFVNTGRDIEVTAADVSPLMRLMKEARLCETPDHRDSYVDIVGYTLTGAEINGVAA